MGTLHFNILSVPFYYYCIINVSLLLFERNVFKVLIVSITSFEFKVHWPGSNPFNNRFQFQIEAIALIELLFFSFQYLKLEILEVYTCIIRKCGENKCPQIFMLANMDGQRARKYGN